MSDESVKLLRSYRGGSVAAAVRAIREHGNFRTIPTTNIAASQINTEIGRPFNYGFSINDPVVRRLAGRPSGQIAFSDFAGKTDNVIIREDWIDSSRAFTLDPLCTKFYFEIVAGGGGGGGAAIYDMGGGGAGDWDAGQGSGGGGAGQFKSGWITVTDRNLYLVIGAGGAGGTQTRPARGHDLRAGYAGTSGEWGGNTDIRIGSAGGTVLAWAQGGEGGHSGSGNAWDGYSGSGGKDGDGNAGGAGFKVTSADVNKNTYGNNGAGGAGGSGSCVPLTDQGYDGLDRYASRGGNGGRAGDNGGGRDMTQGEHKCGIGSCGGGGGKSAAPWGGNGGRGGAASRRSKSNGNWLYYQASHATGYGNGGGGACKAVYSSYNAIAGNGSNGRVYIKQYTR